MPSIEFERGVSRIGRDAWDALVGDAGSPFLEWGFLSSLEDAHCVQARSGWQPRPLVVRERGELLAACPLYAKEHSEGEFVFDWAWAEAAQGAGINYYPKWLVGVPFTPVTGARMLVHPRADRPRMLRLLAGALRDLSIANDISGVHVNFCLEDEREALVESGFLPRLGFQYHWRNDGYGTFDDFLARFRSKRRNQIQRERRSLDALGIRISTYVGDEIPDEVFPLLYPIYQSTIEKNPWGRQYLNAGFFDLLRDRFRSRLCVAIAWEGDAVVAGTINVQKNKTLYGRYWGALRDVRHLHFALCYYAGVAHCVEHRLGHFEPGAGGDYKQLRGFDATPTWSAHFIAEPRLRAAVARFLAQERDRAAEMIGMLQRESALKDA